MQKTGQADVCGSEYPDLLIAVIPLATPEIFLGQSP